MLEVKEINVFRGDAQILWGLTMKVERGEIVTVLGANGSGKTTLVESILGVHHPKKGRITFLDTEITFKPSFHITRIGISCVPEGRRIFKDMEVYENLEMGAYPEKARISLKETVERVYSLFPILRERKKQIAGTLSGGEQQMLAIGRALMSKPTLLLIDELSLGLSPKITKEIYGAIKKLHQEGMTLLLIEQNAMLALRHSDRGYVLETGRITLQGTSQELLGNEHIRKAYLGM
ncbi:MAG: ABC transporter ATP-binding protein [Deltaproteobacteria bacterium CG_4_8_14_3_um_filter_45_9]|nr:MAG: ABC transporter ATP-binding protein [Deltaproteobacteria bacterium CG03_land_8_20_14_0_80_45_14]PIX22843.1 MAG: ABC transporter ATP-binding protein [Deltaproteobacteria bacterium CG_4_8_14_3_um_filter_45_9]